MRSSLGDYTSTYAGEGRQRSTSFDTEVADHVHVLGLNMRTRPDRHVALVRQGTPLETHQRRVFCQIVPDRALGTSLDLGTLLALAATLLDSFRRSGRLRLSIVVCARVLIASSAISACVKASPAADISDPGFPFGPSAVSTQSLAYLQDIKPIFDADCLSCHSSRDARGNYSVSTYAEVMSGQRPGDAQSSAVVDCSPGGSMYRYFSGDAVTKATKVFRWMVVYDAAQTR
jgi:hypothetical protein